MERRERQIFREESKELNREDYKKLVREAKRMGNQRLYYLLQTLGTTGIRVSELSSITVEGLKNRACGFTARERSGWCFCRSRWLSSCGCTAA